MQFDLSKSKPLYKKVIIVKLLITCLVECSEIIQLDTNVG